MSEPEQESGPDLPEHPGWRIDYWLTAADKSQKWLAEQIGHSTKHVSQLQNGHRLWTWKTATKLAEVTGIPADDWMRWRYQYEAAVRKANTHGPT